MGGTFWESRVSCFIYKDRWTILCDRLVGWLVFDRVGKGKARGVQDHEGSCYSFHFIMFGPTFKKKCVTLFIGTKRQSVVDGIIIVGSLDSLVFNSKSFFFFGKFEYMQLFEWKHMLRFVPKIYTYTYKEKKIDSFQSDRLAVLSNKCIRSHFPKETSKLQQDKSVRKVNSVKLRDSWSRKFQWSKIFISPMKCHFQGTFLQQLALSFATVFPVICKVNYSFVHRGPSRLHV